MSAKYVMPKRQFGDGPSLLVANLDGVDVDSGTAWEIGYAIAQKKTVIGIRTDLRAFSPSEPVNLMLLQSCVFVRTLDELSEYFNFYKAVAAGARR
jgi:nucleoside 2-deoxyribosyltransferase